jgi:hypothetical protein
MTLRGLAVAGGLALAMAAGWGARSLVEPRPPSAPEPCRAATPEQVRAIVAGMTAQRAPAAVVAAVAVTAVLTPVRAQEPGLRKLEPQRVYIDGIGGSLGVNVRDVTAEEGQRAKLSPPLGAYVTGVETGSPAEKAGLHAPESIEDRERDRGELHDPNELGMTV